MGLGLGSGLGLGLEFEEVTGGGVGVGCEGWRGRTREECGGGCGAEQRRLQQQLLEW